MKTRNTRGKGCGKDAPWKSLKADFSTSLGNPAKNAGFPLFHTAPTTTGYSFFGGLTGAGPDRRNWLPLSPALTNNYTYVLWQSQNGPLLTGQISIWSLDPNLNYVTSHVYGPYAGWKPVSISVSQDGANTLRVLWRGTQGQVSVWALDANLNLLTYAGYGPYPVEIPRRSTLAVAVGITEGAASPATMLGGTCFSRASCAFGHRFLGDSLIGFAAN